MDASAGYGMQPAQPQYATQNPYQAAPVQYGAPPTNQYGAAPNQYGAPPQNQYGAPMQQQQQYGVGAPPVQTGNPYANNPPQTTTEEDAEGGKEIYKEEEKADPWKFTPEWDDATQLKAKTACCCCSCAFDDCEDVMQLQCESVCLCLSSSVSWRLFQCQDPSQRACCLNTSKVSLCDMTSQDEDVFCRLYYCGIQGIFCLCCSGKANEAICDPCQMPDTFIKQLCQVLCIHLRVALPCDENEVPFEIGCCGFMCKEAENSEE